MLGIPLPINTNSFLAEMSSIAGSQPQNASASTTFSIMFAIEGKGSILPSPGAYNTYNAGDVATITAAEVPDWVFNCWLGDVKDELSPATSLTSSSNQAVTAYFPVIACYLDY